jgi:hypothetical protein
MIVVMAQPLLEKKEECKEVTKMSLVKEPSTEVK